MVSGGSARAKRPRPTSQLNIMTLTLSDLPNLSTPAIDIRPLVLNLCIVDKRLGIQRLGDVIHPAQLDILNQVNLAINSRKPCRIIVLKARQIGVSTIIEGIQFALAFMMKRMRGLVIAHEMDSSEHILGMTQNYFDTFFAREAYTQKNKSSKILSWTETQSQIRISTAKNAKTARGRTIQFLHGSEVGFWDNADTLMTGLAQAVPSLPLSFIFLESTANGIGNYFHTTWNESCAGELDYIPRFYPWWTHPEYLGSSLGIPTITGHLDQEERKLVHLMQNPPLERWNDYTCTPIPGSEILDRLTWRRYAIKNLVKSDMDKFHQEYPSTPEEAFLSTGTNVFPLGKLLTCFKEIQHRTGGLVREGEKVRFQPNVEGALRIFKQPGPGISYIVSGDSKRSIEGDYACIQVLNRRTWEQVAVYRSKVDNVTFGEEMMKLGMYYNTALAVCEIEGGGYGTIAVLLDRNYPYVWQHQKAEKMQGQVDNSFGWSTNWKTKSQALGNLKKAIIDKMTIIRDRHTYNEMVNYVSLPGGKFGNGELEEHDDTVMSYAIAITVIIYEAAEIVNQVASSKPAVLSGSGLRNITMEDSKLPGALSDIEVDQLPDWMNMTVTSDEPEHI